MRKTILIGIASAIGVTAMAADFPYVTFKMTNGSSKAISSENLSMTFQDGNLVATNNDGTFQMPVSGISKFYFDSGTKVETVGAADSNSGVKVFSTTGAYLGVFESADQARESLSPGVYVMRSGNNSIKTVAK